MTIVDWWYSVIDSFFGITITLGIIAMIAGALYSAIKSITRKD